MTAPIPPGHDGIIAHIVVDNGPEAIDFYKSAFGAEEICRCAAPDGKIMHAELRVGTAVVYLCDDFPEHCGGRSRSPKALGNSPVTLHQYVTNCDAALETATAAGANLIMPAADMFWGDRYGMVVDPYGHLWSFGTHIKDMTPEEISEAAASAFG